jgi:hypothetical protein
VSDQDGEELASATIARKVVLESIGETVRDFTYHHDDGRAVIEAGDSEGPVLRVVAIVRSDPPQRRRPRPYRLVAIGITTAGLSLIAAVPTREGGDGWAMLDPDQRMAASPCDHSQAGADGAPAFIR